MSGTYDLTIFTAVDPIDGKKYQRTSMKPPGTYKFAVLGTIYASNGRRRVRYSKTETGARRALSTNIYKDVVVVPVSEVVKTVTRKEVAR